jgi:hypothetical protein
VVEQPASHARAPVPLVDREEGEYPHALALQRERHADDPLAVRRDPSPSGVVL